MCFSTAGRAGFFIFKYLFVYQIHHLSQMNLESTSILIHCLKSSSVTCDCVILMKETKCHLKEQSGP